MDDANGPALQVGFLIETGGSFDELARLQEFMGSTEAKVMRDAASIERATSGMIKGTATTQVTSFGAAATREMRSVARETAVAEKSGEAMVRQLIRQSETFGKTASEIRNMRAEQRALVAESRGLTELAGRIRAVNAEINRLEAGNGRVGTSSRLAGHHVQNLAFQVQDLSMGMVAAANSSAPFKMALMTLFQQGTQIQGIAMQAGVSVRSLGGEIVGMAGRAAAAHPVLLGIAAAAGAVAGAIGLIGDSAEDTAAMQAYVRSLGLTQKEIAKLKDVTVTWGDTAKAVFQVAGRAIWGYIGPAVTSIWNAMKEWLAWIGAGVKSAANFLIGGFVGAFNVIAKTWSSFPAVIGDLFFSAVNMGIKAINALIRKTVDGLNSFISGANAILGKVGLDLPQITAPQINAVANQYAGAFGKIGKVAQGEMKKAFGVDYVGKIGDAFSRSVLGPIRDQARRNAQDRLRAQADALGFLDADGKGGKDKAKELSEAQKAYEAAVKAAQDYAAAQLDEAAKVGLSAKQLRLYADAAAMAKAPTDELKKAIADAAAVREKAYSAQSAKDFQTNIMQPLRDELALYGLVGPARAQAALELEKQAFFAKNMDDGIEVATQRWVEYYAVKSALIAKDKAAQDEAERIKRIREDLDAMIDSARAAGDAIARAFGRAGSAISDVIGVLTQYAKRQAEIDEQVRKGEIDKATGIKQTANLQLQSYGALAGAAKNFFKEGSAGYKTLAAAEKAFALVQLANTAINVAAGAAKMFATLGPWAFPAVAAMIGVMAALGFGGGGSSAKPAEANTGTGTVLGDPEAKSDSIKNAINALKDVDTVMLTYSRQMAASLRSIEDQIGGFASLLVRQGDSINASGGVVQGFNPNAIGSILGKIPLIGGILKGLFGSKTTVIGSGLYGNAQSLGSILSGGFDASYYSDIQKKKKFFGLTTSTKYSTQYTAADPTLENQFTLILRSFNEAILAAAGPLGAATSEIQQRLNGFIVNIGKIDLQGLTGAEIEEKLNAVFGAAADKMATAAFPLISQFQKVGEGAFETLIRVASTLEAVSSTFDLLGQSAQDMSIAAKLGLADQFDSVSDLTSAVDSYFQSFYSKEEQAAARTAQMGKVFESLGLTMPTTIAGFRQLVEAQDLNTAAGQEVYATLLKLAPAFADLQNALNGAKSAADIASERADLQRQLLELQGDTAALRAMQLAKLDASNRALQQQIWDLQDAQAAAKAAQELSDAWKSVGDTIMDEVRRIRGIADANGGGYASLLSQFNVATAAARGGDIDAAKSLPQLSQALLAAAADAATSRQELDRIRAETAASLEATYGLIGALMGNASGGTGDSALLNAAATNQPATVAFNDNGASSTTASVDGLREETAQLRADLTAALATIAGNTGKVAKKMDDITADSGGDAVSVRTAA